MSYDNPRIELTDSMMDVISKMSDGNPGAINVMMQIVMRGEAIDPDDAFGALGTLFSLDNQDCYGSDIWVLYKDVANQDLVTMMGLLRAVQLGYLAGTTLNNAINGSKPFTPEEVERLVQQVKDRLPAFGHA